MEAVSTYSTHCKTVTHVNGGRNRVLNGVKESFGKLRLLDRREARRLIMNERSGDVDRESKQLGSKDDALVHDGLDGSEEGRVDQVA